MKKAMTIIAAALLLAGCGETVVKPSAPAAQTTSAAETAARTAQETTATTTAAAESTTETTIDTFVYDEGGMEMLKVYEQIDQETAKELMAEDNGSVIVDVRRQDEYDGGHIPGAILIPNESIENERPAELPDLGQVILVYCRSGRRSKEAAQKLADMGYIRVYEFGGIIDWTGDIVTE